MHDKLLKVFRFFAKLLILALPFHMVAVYGDMTVFQNLVASHVHAILDAIGVGASLDGAVLVFDGFQVLVSTDSTGWKSIAFLTALILATESEPKEKGVGLFLLLPAIYTVNLIRIAVTSYSAFYGVETFNLFHDILWQGGMVGAVLLLWALWLKKREKMVEAVSQRFSKPFI